MASAFVIWDRTEQRFLGGEPPAVYTTSTAASTAITRVPRHDGGKKAATTYDIVTVTV